MSTPRGSDPTPEAFFGTSPADLPYAETDRDRGLDDFGAAMLSTAPFSPERLSHLGGPQQRILPAMPARAIALGEPRAAISTPDEGPTIEERARESRRSLEPEPVPPRSPMLAIVGTLVALALLSFFVLIFGVRLL